MKQHGFKVVRSSLKENKDFFTYEPERYDIIVSNPPYSKKDEVLERVYALHKPFMLLLPLNSLQGIKRYQYFKNGLQLLCFDKRIEYHRKQNFIDCKKGIPFASVYFCKDILPKDLIIEKLHKYEKPLK